MKEIIDQADQLMLLCDMAGIPIVIGIGKIVNPCLPNTETYIGLRTHEQGDVIKLAEAIMDQIMTNDPGVIKYRLLKASGGLDD